PTRFCACTSSHASRSTLFPYTTLFRSLLEDVHVFGGFEGNENVFSDRENWKENPTILSGELDEVYNDEGIIYENVSHVVTIAGEFSNSILDGFTITGGRAFYADGISIDTNYFITGSYGGGIYVHSARPTLRNLIIQGNQAEVFGGGIYMGENILLDNPVVLDNITFFKNE